MRETSLETSPPTLHALGLRLTLVLGAIEVLARSDHSKSQAKIALTVEDEQQALLPPCWCIKLDDSLWQGARLAIFHTTALWVQIVPAEQSDIAGFVAEGEQVTVIIDRSAGLGKDRMLHWEISVLDPRVEDVWAELERSKKTLNHQMTGELARALSQRGIETSKQEEFECIQSPEHKHMTGELMAVMRQRSEKINDMDSSADSPRQAHVEGSKKPENKQMSGELMDIIARRSAKFNDTNTILDSLSEEQFEHGKKPVPKQMTGELIDVLKQRNAKYYAVDSPPEPVLNVERNTLDGCSAQQVLQEVYSKSIALAKEQQKLTAGGETSPKAEEAWLPPAQSVETPTGRPPRLKVEEPKTAEKTARKAEKEAPGAESNEQLSFKAQESAELPAEVSADFRAMPSTAWTSLHAQFAKNAEPEKVRGDFLQMPASAWTVIHARFTESPDPDKEKARGDFRELPSTAWTALHSKFAKCPEPRPASACGDFRRMPSTAWNALHTAFAKRPNAQGCEAQGCDGQGCDAQGCKAQGCDNQCLDAECCDAQSCDAQGRDAHGFYAQGCDSQGCKAQGCDNHACDAEICDAQGCDAQGCENQGCDDQGCDAQGCKAQSCDTRICDAQSCDAQGCKAQGCDAQRCDAQGCDAQGCDAQSCDAQGCGAQGCDTQGCDAQRCDAQGCDAAQGWYTQGCDDEARDDQESALRIPGDFRAMPSMAWTAIHSKFVKLQPNKTEAVQVPKLWSTFNMAGSPARSIRLAKLSSSVRDDAPPSVLSPLWTTRTKKSSRGQKRSSSISTITLRETSGDSLYFDAPPVRTKHCSANKEQALKGLEKTLLSKQGSSTQFLPPLKKSGSSPCLSALRRPAARGC